MVKLSTNQSKRQQIFNDPRIWRAIFKMVLPTIVAQLIIATYQVVDKIISTNFGVDFLIRNYSAPGIDLSNIQEVKKIINIATGYAGAVTALAFAFSLLISIGTSIKVSINLGKKDYLAIKENIGTGIITSLILSAILLVVLWYITPLILNFQANFENEQIGFDSAHRKIIFLEALHYSRITIAGMVLLFGVNFWIMLFRSEGRIKAIILINLLSFTINIVGDFALVFKLGMAGTAFSTLIAWMTTLVIVLTIIYTSDSYLRIGWKHLRFKPRLAWGIISLGLASLFENIAQAIIMIFTARLLYSLPNKDPSSIPVFVNISSGIAPWIVILNAPIIGLGYGARALVGYAYGQSNFSKIWNYMWRLFILLIALLFFLLMMIGLFGAYMLNIFGVDWNTAYNYRIYIILQFAFYPLATFSYMAIILFQSTNHAKLALFSSSQRTIIMPTICMLLGFYIAKILDSGFFYYLFIGFIDLFAALVLIPLLAFTIWKSKHLIFHHSEDQNLYNLNKQDQNYASKN